MIGKIIWGIVMMLTTLTFTIRAMQGLPIATVFFETREIVLVDKDK